MERLARLEVSRPTLPETVLEIERWLGRMPGRQRKVVGDLGGGMATRLAQLAPRFGDLVTIDDLADSAARVDALVAIDTIRGPKLTDFDRTLVRVRQCLVEGGLLLATFPAAPKSTIAQAMLLDGGDDTPVPPVFHEIELQYRLQRAGLRGAAIRRALDREGRETLVCRAVRRADN